MRVDIALGFGLFAILSIIRLRSSAVTQQEVAYYFVALVMGLVNGLDIDDRRLVVLINALLLVAMAVVDSKPLRERARRMDVHLDVVHADDASLVADLERRLGGHRAAPRGQRRRLRARDHGGRRALPGRDATRPSPRTSGELDVTLDVVHTDDAALVADLERRLGGQVLRHRVKDIDYVRDTMEVDVRYRSGRRSRRTLNGHAHQRPANGTVNGYDEQISGGAVVSTLALVPPATPTRPSPRPRRHGEPRRAGGGRRPPRWSTRSASTS